MKIQSGRRIAHGAGSSIATFAPPPTAPARSAAIAAASVAGGTIVSASTKTRYRPRVSRAPAFRTAAICRQWPESTRAPSRSAIAAVASVEPSSTTRISAPQSSASTASRSAASVAGSVRSSFHAGMTIDSVGAASGMAARVGESNESIVATDETCGRRRGRRRQHVLDGRLCRPSRVPPRSPGLARAAATLATCEPRSRSSHVR